MSLSRIEELVSQAEKEDATLAEVITRSMSEEEIASAETEIRSRISSGYREIEDFMAGVEVASLEHYLTMDEDELANMQQDLASVLSDDSVAEDELF